MGVKKSAKVEFTFDNLGDENAERALWIQLSDRNLISDELLQHKFKNDPEMEKIRLNRETRERGSGSRVPKSGPYYDPQFGEALKKLALQTGVMTPSEVGLRKDATLRDMKTFEREKGEKPALEMRQPSQEANKKEASPPAGRPKNSKDSKKRKREFKPKVRATLEIWLRNAQIKISEILNPHILNAANKEDMRRLSGKQTADAEQLKFKAMYNLKPLDKITVTTINEAVRGSDIGGETMTTYNDWVDQISQDMDRPLTLDELKQVQANIYIANVGEEE